MGYKYSPESLGVSRPVLPGLQALLTWEHREPGWRWPQRGPRHRVQCHTSQQASSPDRGHLPAWLHPPVGASQQNTPYRGV